MWIWKTLQTENGDVDAVVARASAAGLRQVWVRVGDSHDGFYAADYLSRLVPKAHKAGLAVIGWGFPFLHDPVSDAAWSTEAVQWRAPDGSRLDGFSPDIELASEGVVLTERRITLYLGIVRPAAGDMTLVATVYRATDARWNGAYPYRAIAPYVDAFAPMVYWGCAEPGGATQESIARLASPQAGPRHRPGLRRRPRGRPRRRSERRRRRSASSTSPTATGRSVPRSGYGSRCPPSSGPPCPPSCGPGRPPRKPPSSRRQCPNTEIRCLSSRSTCPRACPRPPSTPSRPTPGRPWPRPWPRPTTSGVRPSPRSPPAGPATSTPGPAWARLQAATDAEAYACYRVGYHRGLDQLRQSGWRGQGYVRWRMSPTGASCAPWPAWPGWRAPSASTTRPERCLTFVAQLDPALGRADA